MLFLESLILFSRWLFPMLFESSTVKVVFPNLNKYRIYSLVKFLHHLKKCCGFGEMAWEIFLECGFAQFLQELFHISPIVWLTYSSTSKNQCFDFWSLKHLPLLEGNLTAQSWRTIPLHNLYLSNQKKNWAHCSEIVLQINLSHRETFCDFNSQLFWAELVNHAKRCYTFCIIAYELS